MRLLRKKSVPAPARRFTRCFEQLEERALLSIAAQIPQPTHLGQAAQISPLAQQAARLSLPALTALAGAAAPTNPQLAMSAVAPFPLAPPALSASARTTAGSAAALGTTPGVTYQSIYSTGFEASEGYTQGFLDKQNGWSTFTLPLQASGPAPNVEQPSITAGNAAAGQQHLRVANDPYVPFYPDYENPANSIYYLLGAISPALPAPKNGCYTVSMDIWPDSQGIWPLTSWYVGALSDANGLNSPLTSDICFTWSGEIAVLTNVGSTLGWVDTGHTWNRGQYHKLSLNVDANNGQIQYFFDQELIFNGALWGTPQVRQVLIYDTNTQYWPVACDVDNLSVAQTLIMPARAQAWWDDRLIVSSNPGDNYDDTLYPSDTLYVDWAVQNVGPGPTTQAFSTQLYVDGLLRHTWNVPAGLASWNCYAVEDFDLGTLGVGTHTLRLVPDSSGAAGANNGLDGSYTKTITVEPWGEISGTKWDDLNSNGVREAGELGVAGAVMYLDLDHSGVWNAGEPTCTTDADGAYRFGGLRAGDYLVGDAATSGTLTVDATPGAPAVSSVSLQLGALPANFDLRNVNGADYVTPVRDQGAIGNCWGFATYGALESAILKAGGPARDFSENHQKNYNGFDLWAFEGGNYPISQAYLSRGSGPVNESDAPYHDWDDVPSAGGTPDYYVRESTVFDTPAEIKAAVMTYGALFTDMCWDWNAYDYTNPATKYTFYYDGAAPSNHAVTIVGWDDAKVTRAATPGAWLIKNSWGTAANDGTNLYFDQGYFWISYADVDACHTATAFHDAAPAATFEHIYTYDEHGAVNALSVSQACNAFTPQVHENLKAVQFYTLVDGAAYDLDIYDSFSGDGFSGLLGSVSGTAAYQGYHTVDLPTPVSLTAGRTFYVLVRLTGGGDYPMAFDYAQPGYSSTSRSQPGQSYYFDTDLGAWADLTSLTDPGGRIDYTTANFCIKALASDVSVPTASAVALAPGAQAGGVDFSAAALHGSTTFASGMLNENLPAGSTVGTLTTTMAGSTGPFTYSLASGAGDADNAAFSIVGNQLKTLGPLNFETQSVYTVRVRTADANGAWFESPFTIRVLDVNEAPTLVAAANAAPTFVTGLSTALSVQAVDDHGAGNLVYHWSVTGPAGVAWSDNDTNTASNATVTFQKAGNYLFNVTVSDAQGLTLSSSVNVSVQQTLSALTISPSSANLLGGATQQFTAAAFDQFQQALVAPPAFQWTASAGSVSAAGLFTAPLADGLVTIGVSSGGYSATANVTVATLPRILAWQSVVSHGNGVGAVGLTISDDNKFSEPRAAGVGKLLIFFDEAIAAASFTQAAVQIVGNKANNVPVNFALATIVASLSPDGLVGQISFSPALPDQARYSVRLVGLTDLAGNALAGDNDRVFSALKGDANNDLRVNVTDLSYIQSASTAKVNAAVVKQVRSDVNLDGKINVTDLSLAWAQTTHDVRLVSVPTLPLASPALLVGTATVAAASSSGIGLPTPVLLTAANTAAASAAGTLKIDWTGVEASAADQVLAAWRY